MKTTLLIAAMPEEKDAILHELRSYGTSSSITYSEGLQITASRFEIHDHEILVAQSGIGSVQAALTLALIAEKTTLHQVVLLGVGGALHSNLQIGDLVVADAVLQHDSFASLSCGEFRMLAGDYILDEEKGRGYDAKIACAKPLSELIFDRTQGRKWRGTVLSGGEIACTTERKSAIAAHDPNALLVEMEAAGIAQVASKLQIPFAIAKTVSDRLAPDGTIENDFLSCLQSAAEHASRVVHILLDV